MVGRPQTTRAIPKRLRRFCAAVCSRRPLCLPPRCAPPATCSGVACLWHLHGLSSLAHVHNTHSQYHLPAIGKKIAYKANREGVAARFADPAVQKSLAVDLALITSYAERLRDVALTIVTTANHHDANTRYLLQTVPGIGTILSLVLLYDIHQIDRFPQGTRCPSPLAAWGNVARHRQANAGGPQGPQSATPISRGLF